MMMMLNHYLAGLRHLARHHKNPVDFIGWT